MQPLGSIDRGFLELQAPLAASSNIEDADDYGAACIQRKLVAELRNCILLSLHRKTRG